MSVGKEKCDFCPIGKFTDIEYVDCYNCPQHCLQCEGGNHGGKCVQCEPGYGLKADRLGCFMCENGMYSDGTTECLSSANNSVFIFDYTTEKYKYNFCEKNCLVCEDDVCVTCVNGYPIEALDKHVAYPTFMKEYLAKMPKEIVHIVTNEREE